MNSRLQIALLFALVALPLIAFVIWRGSRANETPITSEPAPPSPVAVAVAATTEDQPSPTSQSGTAPEPAPTSPSASAGSDSQKGPKTDPIAAGAAKVPASLDSAFKRLAEIDGQTEESLALIREIATRWAETDPEGAMRWALGLGGAERRIASQQILPALIAGDPSAAYDTLIALALTSEVSPDYEVARILQIWSATDPRAAWEAAEILEDPFRTQAESAILLNWASIDPTTAALILDQISNEDPDISQFVSIFPEVAQHLLDQDPDAAVAWVSGLPEGLGREAAVHGLVQNWTHQDPAAASAWVSDLDTGPMRDAAVQGFVPAYRIQNPEDALEWSLNVSDAEQRSRLLQQTALYWLTTRPEEARSSIQNNSSLSNAEKTGIFSIFDSTAGQ